MHENSSVVQRVFKAIGGGLILIGALLLLYAVLQWVEWRVLKCNQQPDGSGCSLDMLRTTFTFGGLGISLLIVGSPLLRPQRLLATLESVTSSPMVLIGICGVVVGFVLLGRSGLTGIEYLTSKDRPRDFLERALTLGVAGIALIGASSVLRRIGRQTRPADGVVTVTRPVLARSNPFTIQRAGGAIPLPYNGATRTLRGKVRGIEWADVPVGQEVRSTSDPTIPIPIYGVGLGTDIWSRAANLILTKVSFRLEEDTGDPNPGRLHPVEVAFLTEGSAVAKSVRDADEVAVTGEYLGCGIFTPWSIQNITTRQKIIADDHDKRDELRRFVSTKGFSTEHIGYLERTFLDDAATVAQELVQVRSQALDVSHIHLLRIRTIAHPVRDDKQYESKLLPGMADVLRGISQLATPFVFALVGGEQAETALYLGVVTDETKAEQGALPQVVAALQGAFSGIQCEALTREEVGALSARLRAMRQSALVTGTPTAKGAAREVGRYQIDQMVGGMKGKAWAYVMTAAPLARQEVSRLYDAVLKEFNEVQDAELRGGSQNQTAQEYRGRLEQFRQKLEQGKANGMWHNFGYVAAEKLADFRAATSLIKLAFGGDGSQPDAVRVLTGGDLTDVMATFATLPITPEKPPGHIQYRYKYASLINSNELAVYAHLPSVETWGLQRVERGGWGEQPPRRNVNRPELSFGKILSNGIATSANYGIDIDMLTKHMLVAGLQGSGKTTTVLQLLIQLWKLGIPFLVIEPVERADYRQLDHEEALRKDLRVYTLGDETIAPLRLNPFYVMRDVRLQTHIERLQEVITNSIGLWQPLPHVVGLCLETIYRDKGWNLSTGENSRGDHPDAYPTLTDLYRAIKPVVKAQEYDPEVENRLIGALQVRVGSLRRGSKGMLLDTTENFNIGDLLTKPTVLELGNMGNDEDKAFVMSLLLLLLDEYHGSLGKSSQRELRHVTVIEEAHRLFTATEGQYDPEQANASSTIAQRFANLLAEISTFGEGIIIVEQIPAKLAGDIAKLTSLKILHRTVATEDRNYIGGMMNMNEVQARQVATFETGMAAVFSGGDERPVLVRMPPPPKWPQRTKREADEMVRLIMAKHRASKEANEQEDKPLHLGEAGTLRLEIGEIIERSEFVQAVARFVLMMVVNPETFTVEYGNLVQAVHKFNVRNIDRAGFEDQVILCALDEYFDRRGREYGWCYAEVEGIKRHFLHDLVAAQTAVRGMERVDDPRAATMAAVMQGFRTAYVTLCQVGNYPYAGCAKICAERICLYRFGNQAILDDGQLKAEQFIEADMGVRTEEADAYWRPLVRTLRLYAGRVLLSGIRQEDDKAAACLGTQAIERLPAADTQVRTRFVRNLVEAIKAKEEEHGD